MHFLEYLRDIGKGFLESDNGCDHFSYSAFIGLVRYFEYTTLAQNISVNTHAKNGVYRCPVGTLDALFADFI